VRRPCPQAGVGGIELPFEVVEQRPFPLSQHDSSSFHLCVWLQQPWSEAVPPRLRDQTCRRLSSAQVRQLSSPFRFTSMTRAEEEDSDYQGDEGGAGDAEPKKEQCERNPAYGL